MTSENGSKRTVPGRLDYAHTHKVHNWLLSLKPDDASRSSSTNLAQRATAVLAFNVSSSSTINTIRYGVMGLVSNRGPSPAPGASSGKIAALEKRIEMHERWITEVCRQLGIGEPTFTLEG